MRYFFDTEFMENGANFPIVLLSIGIVSEDNRQYYAESLNGYEQIDKLANDFVLNNVIPHMKGIDTAKSISDIGNEIKNFIGNDKPEFWAYFADYDWVCLCQLFGTMMALPKGWPMYCNDLMQYKKSKGLNGSINIKTDDLTEHNALSDAIFNKRLYKAIANAH